MIYYIAIFNFLKVFEEDLYLEIIKVKFSIYLIKVCTRSILRYGHFHKCKYGHVLFVKPLRRGIEMYKP